MKKNIRINLLIVLLSIITTPSFLKAQANIDSIFKSYQTFFTPSNKYGRNDSVGKYYDIRGIRMYVEVYGQGEPLLLIHGNGNTIRNISPLIYDFQNKYKVIAVDCRNYGKSIDKGDSLSDEMIADDLSELLIQMNINSVYVLGLSSGANSALWLAAKYPNQVKKAAIDGANLTTSAETIGEYWNIHHKNLLDSISNIQNKTEKDKIELKNIKREYNNMTFEDLHKIQAPTMIISGDYDVIKPSHSVQIFENIKKSYLYIQPSSGHLIAWIYKNEFVKMIDHFFSTPYKQFTEKDKSDWNPK
jgi:pimeloyl-ACP methyl ester carboxylesterase